MLNAKLNGELQLQRNTFYYFFLNQVLVINDKENNISLKYEINMK